MITPQQSRMARAALDMGVRELAKLADVSPNTVARLERGERLHRRTHDYIRGVFEAAGVAFISSGAVSGQGGQGVRLVGETPSSRFGKLLNAFWKVPNANTEPDAAYAALLEILARYLEIIQNEGREPDEWERLALNHVLNNLNKCQVTGAYWDMKNAITPPDNQSPEFRISDADRELIRLFDLKYFHVCLEHLAARSYAPPT